MNLRLAGFQHESIVDGPGIRLAIYFQGCSHQCPGCHNPETHDPLGGKNFNLVEIVAKMGRCRNIDGVTLSGGEPFEQSRSAAALAAEIGRLELNLILYSGYTFEVLYEKGLVDRYTRSLLDSSWLLVDGPFVLEERDLTLPHRGSRNQRLIDLRRSMQAGRAVEWNTLPESTAAKKEKGGF